MGHAGAIVQLGAQGGGDQVAEALAYLASIKLPPHQLQKLGLSADWNKNISADFVRRVLELIERHRPLLEELAKY